MTNRNEFGESSLVSPVEYGVRNDLALSTAYASVSRNQTPLGDVFGAIPEIAKDGHTNDTDGSPLSSHLLHLRVIKTARRF